MLIQFYPLLNFPAEDVGCRYSIPPAKQAALAVKKGAQVSFSDPTLSMGCIPQAFISIKQILSIEYDSTSMASHSSLNKMLLIGGRRAHARHLSVSNKCHHHVVCKLEKVSFLLLNMMPLV